jgi:hypothetical protein
MSEPVLSKETQLLSPLDPNVSADSSVATISSFGSGFKKRVKTGSLQKSLRKPTATVPSSSELLNSDDGSEDDDSDGGPGIRSSDVIAGRKRKRGGIIQAASTRKTTKEDVGVTYDVSQSSGVHLDPKNQAVAVSAEFNEDELLGRTKSTTAVEASSDNLYRGQKGYRTLIPKREQITTKYNAMGPQKSASNIRMTTYTDYAPGLSLLLTKAN